MHETTLRVRSTQVDQLGHLNNAAFLEIFEWARWEWAEDGGGGFSDMMSSQGLGPVVVRAEVDFRREVRFHDRVRIQTRLESCDTRKGIIQQHMVREDGQVAAEARFTFVIIDLAARRVVEMPREVVEMAAR
jgi:YbgC/YbaW family acyl-CoA thioester hydrolase